MAAVIMFALATADLALNLHHVAYPGGVDSDLDMESTKYNFAFYLTSKYVFSLSNLQPDLIPTVLFLMDSL